MWWWLDKNGNPTPKNKIEAYAKSKGWQKPNKNRKTKRSRTRYERPRVSALIHRGWHRTTHDHPYAIAWLEDASRKVRAAGEFDAPRGERSIATFQAAQTELADRGVCIHQANTDNRPEFYANQQQGKKQGESDFTNYLESQGSLHIPSRTDDPQTNGKLERLWYEYDAHRWAFDTLDESFAWHPDQIREELWIDGELGIWKTLGEAFQRKLLPKTLLRLHEPLINGTQDRLTVRSIYRTPKTGFNTNLGNRQSIYVQGLHGRWVNRMFRILTLAISAILVAGCVSDSSQSAQPSADVPVDSPAKAPTKADPLPSTPEPTSLALSAGPEDAPFYLHLELAAAHQDQCSIVANASGPGGNQTLNFVAAIDVPGAERGGRNLSVAVQPQNPRISLAEQHVQAPPVPGEDWNVDLGASDKPTSLHPGDIIRATFLVLDLTEPGFSMRLECGEAHNLTISGGTETVAAYAPGSFPQGTGFSMPGHAAASWDEAFVASTQTENISVFVAYRVDGDASHSGRVLIETPLQTIDEFDIEDEKTIGIHRYTMSPDDVRLALDYELQGTGVLAAGAAGWRHHDDLRFIQSR